MYSLEYIIIAKIQMHSPIFCRGIPYFVFWHHIGTICDVSYLICIIQNREYLLNERRYRKKENTIVRHFERPFT